MGTFITYDESYLSTRKMAYARIFVHLDLTGGLPKFINIQWRNSSRRQMLDYEGVPFKCRHCHKVGHLFKDFLLNKWNNRHSERSLPLFMLVQDALS